MGLTPDVAAGNLIQSAWGNQIRDRTLQRFATYAELVAGWPDAAKGAAAVTTDTNAIYVFDGAAWVGARPQVLSGIDVTQVPAGEAGVSGAAIAFGDTFATPPTVVGTIYAVSTALDLVHMLQGLTVTGFTYRVVSRTGTVAASAFPFHFHWLAVGQLAT